MDIEKELEELKRELHRKSIKYSATSERDYVIKAMYRETIRNALHALLQNDIELAKDILLKSIE